MVCVFYGTASLALGLVNKAVLSEYKFNCIFLLLSTQMLLQVVLCVVFRDYLGNPTGIPKYDRVTHYESLLVGFAYVANVAVGMLGLSLVNVPMFFCIRRLVSPTILLYEFMRFGKVADTSIQGAVGTIMVGTLIAGWDTLNSDLLGYTVTFINNLCTAASSVAQKTFSDRTKLGAQGTLYYTSLTALPLSLLMALAFGEFGTLANYEYLDNGGFWFGFMVALALGPILTYSSILCTTYNSPLAMSVTGNIKDVASTVLGAILFPGFQATSKSVGGLALTFVGAGAYSYINLKKGQSAKPAASVEGAAAPSNGGGPSKEEEEEGQLMPVQLEKEGETLKRGNKA